MHTKCDLQLVLCDTTPILKKKSDSWNGLDAERPLQADIC